MSASTHSPVLIVDDDVDLAEGLGIALEGRGYRVSIAHSGEDAIERFRSEDFDLCLLDVRLPNMDGVECFLELLKIRPTVKVVFMTGYRVQDRLKEGLEHGALRVMDKPLDMREVFALAETTRRRCVIVADDDADFGAGLQQILSSRDYRVVVVQDGEAALQAIQKHSCDLLILDLRMPNLDGFETHAALEAAGIHVPTLVITAFDDEYERSAQQFDSPDVVGLLRKPLDVVQFVSTVDKGVRQK